MNVLCRFRRNVLCDLMLHFCNFGRDRIVPAALLLPLALGGKSIVGRPAGRCAGVYHNPGHAEIILEKI